MKTCSKCNQPRELFDFYRRKDSKSGIRGDCVHCRRKEYQDNKALKQAYQRAYHRSERGREVKRVWNLMIKEKG
jgi:hypothetical protein